MGRGAGSKEKREHDLRHYCNSRHYWTFFNFPGSQPEFYSRRNLTPRCLARQVLACDFRADLVPPHVVIHQRRRPRQPQLRLLQRRLQQPHRPVQRQLRRFF